MLSKVLRIVAGIIGVLLITIPLLTSGQSISDQDSETAMIPPCDVEEGIPFVQDDQITCYWGMSEEILSLPSSIDLADVEIVITWEKSGVWIGIAEASEASKCTLQDGYYECDKDSISMVGSSESSSNSFSWSASSGDYRFVAGGEDQQAVQQFTVEWSYSATLAEESQFMFGAIGLVILVCAALGWTRIRKIVGTNR
tara:strand:+ start:31322 stop:31915 length:594 start_codon:yes stop_codon:yes gene_type:complete